MEITIFINYVLNKAYASALACTLLPGYMITHASSIVPVGISVPFLTAEGKLCCSGSVVRVMDSECSLCLFHIFRTRGWRTCVELKNKAPSS